MAKFQDLQLPTMLEAYADERGLEFHRYSKYHIRIFYRGATGDPDKVVFDAWTSGRYYILQTNYLHGLLERGGEKGQLPRSHGKIADWLDKLFFAVEMAESKYVDD